MDHRAKLKTMWRLGLYLCISLLAISSLCHALDDDDEVDVRQIRGPVKLPAGAKVQSGPGSDLSKLSVSPDGKIVATTSRDGNLLLWDSSTAKLIRTIKADKGEPGGIAFSTDGKSLFSAGEMASVFRWDLDTGKELQKFDGHDGHIGSVATSPDGAKLATTDATGIRLWDLASGKLIHHMIGHKVPGELLSPMPLALDAVTFSADGRLILSEANDETARLWDVASGREVRVLPQHDGSTAAVAMSPLGDVGLSTRGGAASGSPARLRIWEVNTGKIRRVLSGHQGDITCVALSADGRYAYSGAHDRTMRQWEVDTGTEIRRFTLSSAPLQVRSSPDSKTVFTISAAEGMAVWDVTGAPLSNNQQAVDSFDDAWTKLSSRNYDERTAAIKFFLAAKPAEACAELDKRMQAADVGAGDPNLIAKLIEQLNDKSYPIRAKAFDDLEQLGGRARSALIAALDNPSAEVRVRAADLLNAIGGTADWRPVLVVETLALIKSPQASDLLKKLAASGAPHAAHAKAVLARQ